MFKLMAANNKSNTWYEIVALYSVHIFPSVKQNTHKLDQTNIKVMKGTPGGYRDLQGKPAADRPIKTNGAVT